MHFGVLNYEKQHKEGTCKVSGRSVVFSAFYADFCLCPKLLIITTLKAHVDTHTEAMYNKQKQVNILHSKILSIHTYIPL